MSRGEKFREHGCDFRLYRTFYRLYPCVREGLLGAVGIDTDLETRKGVWLQYPLHRDSIHLDLFEQWMKCLRCHISYRQLILRFRCRQKLAGLVCASQVKVNDIGNLTYSRVCRVLAIVSISHSCFLSQEYQDIETCSTAIHRFCPTRKAMNRRTTGFRCFSVRSVHLNRGTIEPFLGDTLWTGTGRREGIDISPQLTMREGAYIVIGAKRFFVEHGLFEAYDCFKLARK